ncbi:MAG: efflux RND transporter periplasmic adaptor subunit [Magnetococcales bacterium]|nr:efflux RND transporter periplasmic adaptor subunit [Nitrospirota bacterium]
MQKTYRINVTFVVVVLICVVILVGCGKPPGSGGPPPMEAPEVAVVTVQPDVVVLTTELPGRTAAYLAAEVRPQVSGIIQKRLFTEGSDVRAGDVLYQIDPAPFQAALDNARATLGKSEANLPSIRMRVERYKELLADNAVSRQDYDDAAASLQQVKADIEYCKTLVQTASINLGYTSITASVSGRIGRSSVTDGSLVTANQPAALAVIQQLDPIYVDVTQSTAQLLRLRRSIQEGHIKQDGANQNRVTLILEDGTKYPLKGRLQFRDVSVDSTTGSVILRVVFPNPKYVLLPGMFVRAEVQDGVNRQAILIPQRAVSRDPKGNPVALIVDAHGKVEQRMLTLDRVMGDRWLVSSGLTPGEQIIVEGVQRARPGASVRVIPFDENKDNHGPPASGHEAQPQKQTNRGT